MTVSSIEVVAVAPQPRTISMQIPPDAAPGTFLVLPLPDGRTVQVAVPPDAAPGAGNKGDLVRDQFCVCHDALPMIVGSAPAELPIKGQVKRDRIEILFAILYYAGERIVDSVFEILFQNG